MALPGTNELGDRAELGMPEMRSRSRAESVGTSMTPAGEVQLASAAESAAQAQLDTEPADHSVVLWDEVVAPDAADLWPISKEPSEDPAAH